MKIDETYYKVDISLREFEDSEDSDYSSKNYRTKEKAISVAKELADRRLAELKQRSDASKVELHMRNPSDIKIVWWKETFKGFIAMKDYFFVLEKHLNLEIIEE